MRDSNRAREVLRRVRSVPAGFVVSYGDLSPGAPRFTGAVLAAVDDPGLPWHRVVRADGSLAKGARQRRLLEAEGTPFRGDRVDMNLARYPLEHAAAPAPRRRGEPRSSLGGAEMPSRPGA
ncbi:MAG TPA: MGMT family protein [Solirubrobacterales bacterium]|nr:MGMT family protein [Solirubrobacterales bacterium]